MKKLLSFLLAVMILGCLPVSADAEGVELMSMSAVPMDGDTGRVLFEKDAHRQMYPASITKIMTGMLALQKLEPEQMLTMSAPAYYAIPGGASSIHLSPEEQISVEQAMYALTVQSANDAANLLAEGVSGTMEDFNALMNETAKALGAENTHFANANGLPRGDHYTTAYDMALITAAALKVPGFCDYFSAVRHTIPPTNKANWSREMENDNKMLSGTYYSEDILMSKTGWTEDSKHTLVSAIRRGDTTLIAVVMYSVPVDTKYIDTWALFDYGFSQFERKTVSAERLISRLGLERTVEEDQEFSFLLPLNKNLDDLEWKTEETEGKLILEASLDGQPFPALELKMLMEEPETSEETTLPTEPETEARTESLEDYAQESLFVPLLPVLVVVPLVLAITAFRKRKKGRYSR